MTSTPSSKSSRVRVAPPGVGRRVGEVEDAALGERRQHLAEGARGGIGVPREHVRVAVFVLQQVVLREELLEQRIVDGDVGILPDAHAQVVPPDRRERRARIGEAVGIPAEVEARLDLPRGPTVQRDDVAGDAPLAELRSDVDRLLGGLVVRARHPQAEAPPRHFGGAAREVGVGIEYPVRRVGSEQEQVERLVVDDERIAAVRPVGVPDAVRNPPRRVHEHAPRAATRARTPRERGVLVRQAGIDPERVLDLRVDQLPALVERAEFLAETVYGLARGERQRRGPLAALLDATERRQAGVAAEVLVGDRRGDGRTLPQQAEGERTAGDLERGVTGAERGQRRVGLGDRAGLGSPDDDPVVGPRAGADAQPKHARAVARHLEDVAGGGRERRAGGRGVDGPWFLEPQVVRRVEVQDHVVSPRTRARGGRGRRRASRRARPIGEGARARRPGVAAARWLRRVS